jgi:hypothetical protein
VAVLLWIRKCPELIAHPGVALLWQKQQLTLRRGVSFCNIAILFTLQEVLNHSDHHPVLFLSNLVEGTYTFHLKVTDAKGESDTDRTTVEVKPGECVEW